MRLHSNILRASHVRDALGAEQGAGRIAHTVTFKTLAEHTSRSHETGIEVQLTSWDKAPGDGRRAGNGGSYGASDQYSATYDEWGWLISAVYAIDPSAVWGSPKSPIYRDRTDFDYQTALTYNPAALIHALTAGDIYGGDPYPYVRKGAARVGREGSLRIDGDSYPRGGNIPRYYLESAYKFEPRTAESVRTFAHMDKVSS